jgi:membrane protein DedA with SNARE-associated domain
VSSPRGPKNFIIGGALSGSGYACINAASHAANTFLVLLLLVVGLTAFIAGVGILWIAWKKSKEEGDDQRKPPSIL